MYLDPLFDHVVIVEKKDHEMKHGAIIIPDMGKEKATVGEVVAVGPGKWSVTGDNFIKTTVQVGDLVAVPAMGGQRVQVKNEKYLIYKEGDLLTKIVTMEVSK